jgi:signal transduction histidine kinase
MIRHTTADGGAEMTAVAPRRFRGPFARWPRASDAILAVLVFLASAMVTEGPGDSLVIRPVGSVPVAVLLVTAVAGATLWWRRREPLAVLGVAVAGWAVLLATREYDLGLLVLVALYGVGRYEPRVRLGLVGLGAAMAVLVAEGLVRSTAWGETVFGVGVQFLVWYVGRQVRLRGERAVQRHRHREAEVRRIVAEERTHIARELHDVVAHQVSMMTVQAGAAQAVAATDPEAASRAMAAVELAGRQALNELRHLLGVLRPDAGSPSGRHDVGPQPGLTDLPRLVDQVRAAGLDIEVRDNLRGPLPIRVQLSAYRIVQEALTNVLKHGGPGTRAEIRLGEDGTDVTIEVLDDAVPGPARPRAAGHGIIGMRERATLLGGSLDTGPRPDGGFRVVARLPVAGESP